MNCSDLSCYRGVCELKENRCPKAVYHPVGTVPECLPAEYRNSDAQKFCYVNIYNIIEIKISSTKSMNLTWN